MLDRMTPALASICKELDIRVVKPAQHRPFTPMQTAAGATLDKILREEGENHLRDVLAVLTESENCKNLLIAPVIKAISRIMAENPLWYAGNASTFLEVMDDVDLVRIYERSKDSKAVVPAHHTIATMLLEKLSKVFRVEEMERLI